MHNHRGGIAPWLLAAVAMGVVLAGIKGDGAGWRDTVGNLSGLYLLLPFLAGRHSRRTPAAALVGIVVTEASLVGFYGYEALAYQMVNSHTVILDSAVAVGGVCSGALFGVLGMFWGHRRRALAGLALGLALICEPGLQWLPGRFYGTRGSVASVRDHPAVYLAEGALGLVICALVIRRARQPVPR